MKFWRLFLTYIVLGTVLQGCDRSAARQLEPTSAPQDKPEVLPHLADILLGGTCVARPSRSVKIKSQVGGEVRDVLIEQGGKVRAGQVMATIDSKDLHLRLQRGEIENDRLTERIKLLQFQLARADREIELLHRSPDGKNSVVPQYSREMVNLAERKSELVDTQLRQRLAELDLQTIREQIRKSSIRAPFDGIILARAVEPGMIVSPGSEATSASEVLFEIGSSSEMFAACVVKEADAVNIRENMRAKLIFDGAPNDEVDGIVKSIAPSIANDGGLTRREFRVKLEKLPSSILPGMHGSVVLTEPKS